MDEKVDSPDKIDRLCQLISLDKLLTQLKLSIFQKYLKPLETFSTADPKCKKEFILRNLVHDSEELDEFIKILLHSGHDAVAYILSPNVLDLIDLKRCDPGNGYSIPSKDILKRNERSMSSVSGIYPMLNSPRGFCLLVNNYFTKGTYKEMQRFRNIFYQLHFDVIMEKNLSAKDIVQRLIQLSQSEQLKSHDAFVFMIITHGNENKEIYGFDEEPIKIEILTEMFNNENCPLLQNKPRMFIFNCCRGTNEDYGTPYLSRQISSSSNKVPASPTMKTPSLLPTTKDILICYSTLDGYLAIVDWESGTSFGKALADSFVEKVWYKDINAVLIRANSYLDAMAKDMKIKQPFEWNQCLTKQILFNPAIPTIKEFKS